MSIMCDLNKEGPSRPSVLDNLDNSLRQLEFEQIGLGRLKNVLYSQEKLTPYSHSLNRLLINWQHNLAKDGIAICIKIVPRAFFHDGQILTIEGQRMEALVCQQLPAINKQLWPYNVVCLLGQSGFIQFKIVKQISNPDFQNRRLLSRHIDVTLGLVNQYTSRIANYIQLFRRNPSPPQTRNPQGIPSTPLGRILENIYLMNFTQEAKKRSFEDMPSESIEAFYKRIKHTAQQRLEKVFGIFQAGEQLRRQVQSQDFNFIDLRQRVHVEELENKSVFQGENLNLYGFKMLRKEEPAFGRENQAGSAEGGHGLVKFYRCSIQTYTSVNLYPMPKHLGSERNEQYIGQFQGYLAEKTHHQKQSSRLSFENELAFIRHAKDWRCRFLPIYYLETEKRAQERKSFYMDVYPQSLYSISNNSQFMNFQRKLKLLEQLACGLLWLSTQNICHRDVKPENVLIDRDWGIRIVDFGSCCQAESAKNKAGCRQFKVATTRLMSTYGYYKKWRELPQELKKKVGKERYQQHLLFDVYSFGVILKECIHQEDNNIPLSIVHILTLLSSRCKESNPDLRPSYPDILFILKQCFEEYANISNQR